MKTILLLTLLFSPLLAARFVTLFVNWLSGDGVRRGSRARVASHGERGAENNAELILEEGAYDHSLYSFEIDENARFSGRSLND